MRVQGVLVIMTVAVLALFSAAISEDKPWFDMENCSFCKTLTEDPHLMDNITWENYDISNGLLTVTIVKPESKDSYLNAQKGMEKMAMEMAGGKTDVNMCGHCETYGSLMMAGAKFEHIESGAGYISLMTTDNPELLAKIQKFGQRNRDEFAKMEKTD
jgi:hypothetical protein